MNTAEKAEIEDIVIKALNEDIRSGDITTNAIIPPDKIFTGKFIAKADGIIAGLLVIELAFLELEPPFNFNDTFYRWQPGKKG